MENISPRQLIEVLIRTSNPLGREAAWQSLLELGEAGDDEVVAYILRFDYESDDWSYLNKAIEKMGDSFLEKIAEEIQHSEHQSRTSDLFEMIEEMGQPAVPYLVRIMEGRTVSWRRAALVRNILPTCGVGALAGMAADEGKWLI